jgi:hypothetical protein
VLIDSEPPPAKPGDAPAHGGHTVHLALSYRVLAILIALILLPWILALATVVLYLPVREKPPLRPVQSGPSAMLVGNEVKGNPGPWGNLVYVPIHLAPPDELIDPRSWDTLPLTWHLPNTKAADLETLLAGNDLTAVQREALRAAAKESPEIEGFVLHPPEAVVLSLSPEARARLYRRLAQSPKNKAQTEAFRFCGTDPEEWLGNSSLDPATVDLLKSLVYRNGRYMLFADLAAVTPKLGSPDVKFHLLKLLEHEKTFLVRLKIDDSTDVDALVAYWGRGGRAKDVRPLIEAMANLPGSHTLPVTNLLPGFARRRTFTYPSQAEASSALRRDCHWTAMNFFTEEPDDRLANPDVRAKLLASDYYVIYSGFQLGDLVLFLSGPGEILHSAVYVADDVVFTQSGNQPSDPWVFSRIDDLKDYYPSEKPITVSVFRHKGV